MCVTSVVMDQWWPKKIDDYFTSPFKPPLPPLPTPNEAPPWPAITPDLAKQMLEVIKRLEAIDKRLGSLEQCKVAAGEKKAVKAKLRRIAAKHPKTTGASDD